MFEAGLQDQPRLRVGVAGLGVIGGGAALKLMNDTEPFDLVGALVADKTKARAEALSDVPLFDGLDAFLGAELDVVIDALPSGEAGAALIETALSNAVSIVSANKQALAGRLAKFHDLADDNNCGLAYSASVGGGAPMIETVCLAKKASAVTSLSAILNGTVNYILTTVSPAVSFQDAVAQAQEAGFAEPDPRADLSGEDARAKIAILSYEAFGEEIPVDEITLAALDAEGARDMVRKGGHWRQVARMKAGGDGAKARLNLERVDDDVFFRTVVKEGNALRLKRADGEIKLCAGKGAGRAPTVDSILADLYRLKRRAAKRVNA